MKETIKKRKRKKGFSRVLSVFLAMVLCLSTVLGMPGLGIQVRAAGEDDYDTVRFDITGPSYLTVGQAGLSKNNFTVKSTLRNGEEYTETIESLNGSATNASITGDESSYSASIFIDDGFTIYNTEIYYNGNLVQVLDDNKFIKNLTISISFDCKVTFNSYDQTTNIQTLYVPNGCVVPQPDATNNPAESGYTFDGWVSNGTTYDFSNPTNTNSLTLSASLWSNTPTYTWNEDNTKVTGSKVNLNESVTAITETVDIDPSLSTITTAPTCMETGTGTVTSKAFTNTAFSAQTKEVVLPISASAHDLTHYSANAPTFYADGNVEYWECAICGKKFSDSEGTTEITNVVDPQLICFTYDNKVLTLCGNVEVEPIRYFDKRDEVQKIVASEGTVFPEDCSSLFNGYSNCTTIDLSKADTSKVTDMSYMFCYCQKLESLNISNINTKKVTDMSYMFYDCKKLTNLDLNSFVTPVLSSVNGMFYNCDNLTVLNIENLKTDQNTDFGYMFSGCSNLKELILGTGITQIPENTYLENGTKGWACGSETGDNISGAYGYAVINNSGKNTYYKRIILSGTVSIRNDHNYSSFVPMSGKELTIVIDNEECSRENLSYQWKRGSKNISGATSSTYTLTKEDIGNKISCVIKDKTGVYKGELVATTESKVVQGPEVSFKNGVLTIGGRVSAQDIQNAAPKEKVKKIIANEGTVLPENCGGLFWDYSNCTSIDLSNVDSSNVTEMYRMFEQCTSLIEVKLDGFNTDQVTDMSAMFNGCTSIQKLDLSSFNTEHVMNMNSMFCNCTSLEELDLSSFNTTNTGMQSLFSNCTGLKKLTLGKDFTTVPYYTELLNGAGGWSKESDTGERISGDDMYADFTNDGTNTYYKRFVLEGSVTILNEEDYESFVPLTGNTLRANVSIAECPMENLSYQWKRGNKNISGATSSTYTPTKEDIGYIISCVVKDKTGVYKGEFVDTTYSEVVQAPEVSFKNGVLTIGGGISADDIHNAASKEKVKKIVASEGTVLPEECSFLFYEYSNCTTIDLSNADTSHVTSMYGMFCECSSLETLKIDHFDTSKVTDIRDMFAHCVKLTSLDLSSFNMKNVSLRSGMFYSADALQTLTLGDGFKRIQADDNLFNGNSGWAKGSATGKKISGADKDYAVFSNSGKNTYYKLKEQFVATTNLVLYGSWSYVETPVCGQTLHVNVFDCNVPSNKISLQWKRGNTEISGATDYTYTLVAADVGYKISCVVKEKTGAYVGEFVASLPNKVEKADGPAKPTGLKATAPSVQGAADGKITGVTKAMEYATNTSFKNAVKCTSTTITGLKAGTYYVRVAETGTTKAGAYATVTVKDGAAAHTHGGTNATYHKAVAATCTTAGNSAYYECNCGKYFSDKACTKEISKDSWVIAKLGHNYGKATYTWSADYKTVTGTKVCQNDASHTITQKVTTTYEEVKAATETADGVGRYTATFTNKNFTTQVKDVTITKLSHKHGGTNATYHKAVAATCEKAGNSAYYECNCGKYFSDKACTKEISKNSWVIAKLGHNYGKATYKWSSDFKTVTGTRVCKNDSSHIETETVTTTYKIVKAATETEVGTGRYTAVFTKEGFSKQVKDVEIPKGKHKHGGKNATYHKAVAATCTKAGSSAYWECSCGKYFSDEACTKAITKDSWVIAKLGHNYGKATYTWSADNKSVTATRVCKNDASHVETETVTTTYKVITKATENEDGLGRYTATFTKSGFKAQTKDVTITKLSHKHSLTYHKAVAATCEKAGNSAYYSCSCGKYFSDKAGTKEINKNSWVIKATGHNYGKATYKWSSDYKTVTGTRVCKTDSSHTMTEKVKTTYEIVKKPTKTSTGTGRYTAVFTKEGFTTQTKEVEIPKEKSESKGDVTKIFGDVIEGQWYVAAVQFVYDNGYMNGVSATSFAPNMTLTREQFVTVLYNLEGNPNIKYSSKFTDVPEGTWYSLSVTWAAEKGITSGVSKTEFGTGKKITREQLATMIYNYAKYKGYNTGSDKNAIKDFPDKGKVSSWAEEGIKWAVTNKVMNGKRKSDGQNYLDPSGEASRAECAQMVKNLCENVVGK